MTEFFEDAWGTVGKTQFECMSCDGRGVYYNETCFGCGGRGWVCEEEEYTQDERDDEEYQEIYGNENIWEGQGTFTGY